MTHKKIGGLMLWKEKAESNRLQADRRQNLLNGYQPTDNF
jgi:hypothetical protein